MSQTGFLTYLCLFIACCVGYSEAFPSKLSQEAVNDRPVIGVLTQIVSDDVMKPFGRTYIPASYVKYLESGGSRVMPIRLTLTTAEYENIFKKINGLLFIGGAVDLETSDFARVAKIFYRLALMANDAGDFFPIWGTCMGLQLLTVLVAGESLLTDTLAENVALPLNLTTEAHSSRMFEGFPDKLMTALTQEPLTGNFHHFGVTVQNFQENKKLNSFFSLLSTNVAENGAHFISTIEGKRYPFYGVQWHPEVNRFQWDRKKNYPHSARAVQLSSLLAEFFVDEGNMTNTHYQYLITDCVLWNISTPFCQSQSCKNDTVSH
uniref:folate gamma-glutamyl hydrolase n=1 Tax=Amphiprion ocellaris TaxID=80972 RepID=A0AAQ6A4M4_AMPOC